ncbi:MAG TPA: ABC transporter permease [Euzebyales bacterium]|nr:ABC transporter permease [Euzebyales bacterium]
MWAMLVKEFLQLQRDRRTAALLVIQPLILLIVFGYAASFDVGRVRAVVAGPGADQVATQLPTGVEVVSVAPDGTRADAEDALRNGEAVLGVVAGPAPVALIDGSDLFAARALQGALPAGLRQEVLFNPDLETPPIMVPGLIGLIMLFVGGIATSLGVVRERQSGTMEQLAVMPLRPWDVFFGKLAPYLGIAALDTAVVVLVGVWLFDVPFNGSVWVFTLGALLFLFTALGLGVLISTLSQTQAQAIQLAILTLVPQVLLSGLIFPLEALADGIRPIAYAMPLTWFVQIARGTMLRGSDLTALAQPFGVLALIATFVVVVAVLRFRHDLTPQRAVAR